jgi:uncharacterized protein (DUF433 family)
MSIANQTDPVPLVEDESGALRVGRSRVLLEMVVQAFDDGATPETIVQNYSTLVLADVYAVVAYYLRHREQVGIYLKQRGGMAADVRKPIEADQPDIAKIRERVQKRRTTGN